jgi:biopolymer transport protein ExbD
MFQVHLEEIRLLKKAKRIIETMGDLDLAPIMNLMVTLIPMLLISAAFLELVIVETSLPVYGQTEQVKPQEKLEKPKLGLTLLIKEDGFSLGGQGGMLNIGDGRSTIPKLTDNTYDYITLTNVLYKIKEQYPDEWSIIIVPEFSSTFEVIVGAMDASREATIFDDNNVASKKVLFPNVIIGGGVI